MKRCWQKGEFVHRTVFSLFVLSGRKKKLHTHTPSLKIMVTCIYLNFYFIISRKMVELKCMQKYRSCSWKSSRTRDIHSLPLHFGFCFHCLFLTWSYPSTRDKHLKVHMALSSNSYIETWYSLWLMDMICPTITK